MGLVGRIERGLRCVFAACTRTEKCMQMWHRHACIEEHAVESTLGQSEEEESDYRKRMRAMKKKTGNRTNPRNVDVVTSCQ
jgi:hypothetical protein